MARLRARELSAHAADGATLLRGVDLDVLDGTRVVVLGASGSGKTSLLRAIAGVLPASSGRLWLDERDVTDLPPRERDVALTTQHGSLQPHLDVRGNLGFALRLRGVDRAEIASRVDAEARAFSLERLLRRRPKTLAAGERHEVALARSLVRRCAVLLLDEPFARIDAGRRAALRRELARVQEGYGVTTVLTTNDPTTAWAVAQQVVVMDAGTVLQSGTVAAVAARPATRQVAEVLTLPSPTVLTARLHGRGRDRHLRAGPLRVAAPHLPGGCPQVVDLCVPPDAIALDGVGPAVVRDLAVLGDRVEVTLTGEGQAARVWVARPGPERGQRVAVSVDRSRVHLFDPSSGRAIAHGL